MSTYTGFWKSEFEKNLTSCKSRNLLYWRDITKTLDKEEIPPKEFVYEYATIDPSIFVRIYSSINLETERSRERSTDAVRIVFRRKANPKDRFRDFATRKRTENLMDNLAKSLAQAGNKIANCSIKI